jgi:hypothetical protein
MLRSPNPKAMEKGGGSRLELWLIMPQITRIQAEYAPGGLKALLSLEQDPDHVGNIKRCSSSYSIALVFYFPLSQTVGNSHSQPHSITTYTNQKVHYKQLTC